MEIITWKVPALTAIGESGNLRAFSRVQGKTSETQGWARYRLSRETLGDQVITFRWADWPDVGTSQPEAFFLDVVLSRKNHWRRVEIFGDTRHNDKYRAFQFSRRSLHGDQLQGDSWETVLLIYAPLDTASFMSHLPDEMPLGDISMPGTHETCAFYGYPISQCQQPSTPLSQQFLDGIRLIDIRVKVVGDQLLAYHGIRPQRSSFISILSAIHDFLNSHPQETIIMLVKEEQEPPLHADFSKLLHRDFKPYLAQWFFENRIPQLGEVRGKGILLSRFESSPDDGWDGEVGLGIHPSTWPDSAREGFEWDCRGTNFRIQDWYRVPIFLQIPEKYSLLIHHLTPTLEPSTSSQFTLSYASASSVPGAFPTTIAKGFGWPQWGLGITGVNSRLTQWLLERIADGQRVRACVLTDFYKQEGWPGELLVLMNFIQ